jgi:hypothetical protein
MAATTYHFLDEDGVVYATTDLPLCPRLGEVVTITDGAAGGDDALGPFEVLNVWHDLRRGADGEWVQTVDILVRRPADLRPAFVKGMK